MDKLKILKGSFKDAVNAGYGYVFGYGSGYGFGYGNGTGCGHSTNNGLEVARK